MNCQEFITDEVGENALLIAGHGFCLGNEYGFFVRGMNGEVGKI